MSNRDEKLASLITARAADFFNRQSDRTSMITVIRTELRNKGRTAVIFITVWPVESELAALSFAKRKRAGLKEFIGQTIKLKTTPHLDVELDAGEKNRETIERILRQDKNQSE